MANLENIVKQKTENDGQWKLERQAERENTTALQDASIIEITSHPETYARYLDLQGDNPTYSAGNIALTMVQLDNASIIGTADRWKTLNRTVKSSELNEGAKIFSRSPLSKSYEIKDVYDISQTQGRDIVKPQLQNDSKEMEQAMTTLLNYSPVPVSIDNELDSPALYDEHDMELYINPTYPDHEAFAAIGAEIAQARFHKKGANRNYDRGECELDAQSVSHLLCRRFGIEHDLPDTSQVGDLYAGWDAVERRGALDSIQGMSKQIGGSIEKSISPQPRGRTPEKRPTR